MKITRDTEASGPCSVSPARTGAFQDNDADVPGRHPDRQRVRQMSRCSRRRNETGQALVEFALVLPLVILLMGVAFNGWNGMQLAQRLTSAARAGAIQAANDLSNDLGNQLVNNPSLSQPQIQAALDHATTVVNQEEDTNVYQSTPSCQSNCVSITTSNPPDSIGSGASMNVVTITISAVPVTLVPLVGNISVSVHATARYS